MAQLVNNTYANALLELALEENCLDAFEQKAKSLVEVFDTNREFKVVIEHPEISRAEKLNMLISAIGDDVTDPFAGLFNLVLNKNREKDLYGILAAFLLKVDEHRGIMVARVASATMLDEYKTELIRQRLSKSMNKEIILDIIHDPSLIAGMKITVDGHVIDGTVKKEIEELRNSLYSVELS